MRRTALLTKVILKEISVQIIHFPPTYIERPTQMQGALNVLFQSQYTFSEHDYSI